MATENQIKEKQSGQKAETERKIAIEFSNVSKLFRIQHERKTTLQDFVVNLFRDRGNIEEFWALKNVSFELEKGKTLGLIGQNGAGKSTILKLVTRIIEPTSGRIRVNGRVSAMLELGTGFHPDLSGRDNIFLNGAIYGFNRKEMLERYERIVEFSELGRFIDTPVKHYSSGMYMRLGFATAITVDPDILIIDEVLAVGDAAFSRKCHDALADMKKQGKTLLFVSHAAGEVARFCDEVIYLSKGEAVARGTPSEVLDEYMMTTMSPKYFQAATPTPTPEPEQIPAAAITPTEPTQKSKRRPLKAGTNIASRFWRFSQGANQGELTLALLNPGEKSCKLHLNIGTETTVFTLLAQTPAVIKVNSNDEQGFSLDAESPIAVQEWPESFANGGPKVSAAGTIFPLWDLRADSEARLSILNPGKSSCGLTVWYFQPEQEVIKRAYMAQPGKALLLDPAAELGSDKAWADGGGGVGQTNAPCIGIYVEATAPVLVEKLGFEQTALPFPEELELKPRDRATTN